MKTEALPWTEKYRPEKISEVLSQNSMKELLSRTMAKGTMPHLLLYGPPGTGKTSAVLALARELYGPLASRRVLELNASDERGIDVVRTKVKDFSRLLCNETVPDYLCPPFKIVILDEVDFMTKDAQAALRRIMETEAANTSFCLLCNHISKIISPIKSRCAMFRFTAVEDKKAEERLEKICRLENVLIESSALRLLVGAAEGDMRQAITLLQGLWQLHGSTGITEEAVKKIAGIVEKEEIEEMFLVCLKGTGKEIVDLSKRIIQQAIAVDKIVLGIADRIANDCVLDDKRKIGIIRKMLSVECSLLKGADPFLQLLSLFGSINNST